MLAHDAATDGLSSGGHSFDAPEDDLGRRWERETTIRVMTAYVAHELNHPLGTIINLVNTLSRQMAKSVVRPQEIDECLEKVKTEATRATTVIRHLRMLTERRPTARSNISLLEVCRETSERLRPLFEAKAIKLRFHINTSHSQVNGVKVLLETALYNFLINSVAALDDTQIAHRRLIIRIFEKPDMMLAIQVFDNGCGMPEEIRDHVFEPFVTTRPDGAGLGLAIAGDIIRWHHGTLACLPRRRGTCMEMALPQA